MKDDIAFQAEHAMTVKSVANWLAAFLGIGTFLGFINLAVGLLSAAWLSVQLYGYLAHELPMKRMRKQMLRREFESARARPGELGRMEADE